MSDKEPMIPNQFEPLFVSACALMRDTHNTAKKHREDLAPVFAMQEEVALKLLELKASPAYHDRYLTIAAPTQSQILIEAFGKSARKNYIVGPTTIGMPRIAEKASASYLRALLDAGVSLDWMATALIRRTARYDRDEAHELLLDEIEHFDDIDFLCRMTMNDIHDHPEFFKRLLPRILSAHPAKIQEVYSQLLDESHRCGFMAMILHCLGVQVGSRFLYPRDQHQKMEELESNQTTSLTSHTMIQILSWKRDISLLLGDWDALMLAHDIIERRP